MDGLNTIKIFTKRDPGALYHYAHFICDCLFPEIVNGVYNYSEIVREESLCQTLGIFKSIHEEVTKTKIIELIPEEYAKINLKTTIFPSKWEYANKQSTEIFRDYIFKRYNINSAIYNSKYPEVLLIKRGRVDTLINKADMTAKLSNWSRSNGSARREINNINDLEAHLDKIYKSKFKAVVLEKELFSEQIQYFNNAKLIILAHGSAMSNMFFCKPGTIIVEVVCKKKWRFFNVLAKLLEIRLEKINVNKLHNIISHIGNINRLMV